VILTAEEKRRESLKLWVILVRAYQAISAHDHKSIADHGLTPGEFAVLEALYHKGPLLLGEVRKKVLVSSGGITYLVDRLAAKSLVERRACPEDRRATYVALTPEGEGVIGEAFPAHARALEEALSGLSPAETREAIGLMRKLGLRAQTLLEEHSES
jgi:MarR family 2-MHQ and catechol resistance regulon transcriptional repressor